MKIAMAIENFSLHAGGAEAYAVELACTLVSEGWEVHFFGHSWGGRPEQAVFHRLPSLPGWVPSSARILVFAFLHRRMVRPRDFDVVLGFGNTLAMNVYQSHGGVHYQSNIRKLGAVDNRGLRFLKAVGLFLTPKYYARAWIESAPFRMKQRPVIVAISEMARRDMAEHFRVNEDEIRLVYNGIDAKRFGTGSAGGRAAIRQRFGFEQEVLFLFMAYDFKKKGARQLLEAAGRLRKTVGPGRFGVLLVGGTPSPSLLRLAQERNIKDTVVFAGRTREPEAFYDACDVFILPTFYDACSLVVFEAMAAGLPAITTVHNGASGIITDRVDGLVLQDPSNTDEISRCMEHFLDRDVLTSASAAARETARKYTLENNHRQMIDIFNEVAGKGR